MAVYDLMINTNLRMIIGEGLTGEEKQNIVTCLVGARSTPEEVRRFHIGVRYQENTGQDGNRMYPELFIPPYNGGRKYDTVTGQTPKTHILSANSYELEILRLLILLTPDNAEVNQMKEHTLGRLRTTCYGARGCVVGECFDTSLIVLRFLAAASPWDLAWIRKIIDTYKRHAGDKSRPRALLHYYLLCLSELPAYVAEPELFKYKNFSEEFRNGKQFGAKYKEVQKTE